MEVNNLCFKYSKNSKLILNNVTVKFEKGKIYSIFGPSGSGKTTFLSLLGGLEEPTSGQISIDTKKYSAIKHNDLRKKYVSFIFQSYNLLSYMNAIENVILPMKISKKYKHEELSRAKMLLESVGLNEDEIKRKIKTLSGGQQQRVCIARALACDADYILADEPTGNLDENRAKEIMDIFHQLALRQNKCIIIVSHSNEIRKATNKSFFLNDGKLEQLEGDI